MSLPPVDPERNRELVAGRLGWPDGAVEACRELEARHPEWSVLYCIGGLRSRPDPGYVAYLTQSWHGYKPLLEALGPVGLEARIREEGGRRPRRPW